MMVIKQVQGKFPLDIKIINVI